MNTDDREKHFWNNYIAVLCEARIKPSTHTWYVQHCETFIKANEDTRLKQHTKKSVSLYLSELVNNNKKESWQQKQGIDALRLLFKGIRAPLYLEIDWDYWKSSCQDLGKDHDTNYRSTHKNEGVWPLLYHAVKSGNHPIKLGVMAFRAGRDMTGFRQIHGLRTAFTA
jgi:hypothetical protein